MAEYEAYADSGFEWLGQIPASWKMVLLSQVVTQVKNKNSELQEQNLLSLSYGRIKRKPIDTSGGLLPESFDGYNIIEENDVVLRLTDLQNDHRSLRVGLATERGIITSAYTTMRPRNQGSAKFLYYLLHTFDIRKGFYGMGSGVRQGLNYDEVKKMKLPMPTLAEQAAIAEYLDRETKRIDAIIAEAKASIEEYKAWKASIIYEAITKGLDPNVEMKDSGIEWFGMIPQHWLSMKLRYALENISDVDHFMPESVHEGISYIMTGDLKKLVSQIDIEGCKKISMEDYKKLSQKSKIQIDDVIFARYATIGTVSYVDVDIDCIISYSCVVVSPKRDVLSGKYLYYYLQSEAFASEVGKYINTNIQGNVGKESMYKAKILLPPMAEQSVIVEYLDWRCQTVDSLIAEKEALIKDMEAYKKSLIFEVATGKRRVIE